MSLNPQRLRAARARAAGAHPLPAVDGVGVLRALNAAGVRYVLVGEMAEALHGSPLLTMSDAVTIVPRAGQGEALRAAISAAEGRQATAPTTSTIDAPLRWALEAQGAELVVLPAPPATHGYEDLRRDATQTSVDDDVVVEVASLVDLVRIAQAGEDPARVPALRRTLELADAAADPATRAA